VSWLTAARVLVGSTSAATAIPIAAPIAVSSIRVSSSATVNCPSSP